MDMQFYDIPHGSTYTDRTHKHKHVYIMYILCAS